MLISLIIASHCCWFFIPQYNSDCIVKESEILDIKTTNVDYKDEGYKYVPPT